LNKYSRFFKNVASNSIMMGLMTLFQLISVPIFLKYWGVELYGEWLALNTFTAYFQMTDIGLNTATANSFVFNYVRGHYDKCNILINNNIFFILIAFAFILGVLLILVVTGFFVKLFSFSHIDSSVVNISLLLLFLQVLLGTFNNLLNTLYTATNNYARGIMIDNIIRFLEYFVLIVGVAYGFSILCLFVLGVTVKFLGLFFKYYDSSKLYRLTLGFSYLSKEELKEIFLPAISFFSLPVANSLVFQGLTLLLNYFLGGVAVVLFNTTRTIVNFGRTFVDILYKSVWPEISITYGNNDLLKLRQIHYRTLASSVLITSVICIFLIFSGESLYNLWLNQAVKFNLILFTLLIISMLTNSLWNSSSVILLATNNHKEFSILYLLVSIAVFFSSLILLYLTNDIVYLPISMIFVDLILVIYALKKTMIITNDKLTILFPQTICMFVGIIKSPFNKVKLFGK